MKILGIAGSLRSGSIHTAILVAAQDLVPAGVTLEIAQLHDIPLYDGDMQEREGIPASVSALAAAIADADAVVIASPEYNFSISGVMKNALDWVSRVPDQPFALKPVGIVGASPGNVGTARMQYHLRQVLVFFNARTLNKPELLIARYHELFDDQLTLTDAATRQRLAEFLQALADTAKNSH